MNSWINYHHLYYFKTIAEEQSVSKAAAKLRLGQPTLSAQLKQFEDSLEVKLFDREHKKLILTEQGKVALEYARSIFRMGGEMLEVLHDRMVPTKPTVHIGALDSIPKQVLLEMTRTAFKIMPCQVSLLEGKPDELVRDLYAHKIDLIVTHFLPTGADAKIFVHRSIAKKTVSIYGAPKFKSLRKDFPYSLAGQPVILPTYDSKLRYDIDHWQQANQISFNTIVETQDIAIKKMMAIDGIGLMPAASYTVMRQVLSGELMEIGQLTGLTEELFLVQAKRKIENEIAAKIMRTFVL